MLKKTFQIIFFLFISGCGYEAIHSKKNAINYDFSISELSFIGDRDVNIKIKQKLNSYTLKQKDKDFTLKITSSSEKIIIAKDISGDPTSFKSTITINVEVLKDDNFRNNLLIVENFNYNNNTNKFDLKRYEKEIKNNLAQTATDKLIFKLSNIR
tara:strand:+ start:410 stop:874 length:465 start_codon:yes stop_codon:yes gene_type:complete